MKKRSKLIFGLSLVGAAVVAMNNATASGFESALGDAVINDASATYYNPAALTLVPNRQIVLSDTYVNRYAKFNGSSTLNATATTQTGSAKSDPNWQLPAAFLAVPAPFSDKVTFGIGAIYPFYSITDYGSNSMVRYNTYYAKNTVMDITPAVGVKINNMVSVGAGFDAEYFRSVQNFAFPTLAGDGISINKAADWGYGGHAGILLHPALGTFVGFTYFTPVKFKRTGTSSYVVNGAGLSGSTNTYQSNMTIPPHATLSVYQFLSRKLGLVGTVEYTKWSEIKNAELYHAAFPDGSGGTALSNINQPLNFKNAWRFSLGANYALNSKFDLIGIAGYDQNYIGAANQSSGTPGSNYYTLGLGGQYHFNKAVAVALGYAHQFHNHNTINIAGSTTTQVGYIDNSTDAVMARVVWNLI